MGKDLDRPTPAVIGPYVPDFAVSAPAETSSPTITLTIASGSRAGVYATSRSCLPEGLAPWTGTWTGVREIPALSVRSRAAARGIVAGRVRAAAERASHNPPAVGSSPTRPTCGFTRIHSRSVDRIVDRCRWSDVPSMSWLADRPDT